MKLTRGLFIFLFSISFSAVGRADSVRISQIDTQSLLIDQKVTLYLSVTDQTGEPIDRLSMDNFQIAESDGNGSFADFSKIASFKRGSELKEGVSFLLLIDNSGSMYQTMEGQKTAENARRRITHAKNAVVSFLNSIENPEDKVGLAVYNTFYHSYSAPTKDHTRIVQLLDEIRMPTHKDEFYSEIYGGVLQAVNEFQKIRGRKAIIILSDGENRSLFQNTEIPHQRYGTRIVPYTDPLRELQKEGVSLYVVNFGKKGSKRDRNLMKIGEESGGVTFNAHSQYELERVYYKIKDQIQREYVVSYTANMAPVEKKQVKVVYTNSGESASSQRFYYTSTVFGAPQVSYNPLILIAFILSCGALWGLSRMKFDKQRLQPTLEVVNDDEGATSTQVLYLNGEQTIIGGNNKADLTIAGHADVIDNHATVVFDKKSDEYKLKGNGKVKVNNRPVMTKVLEPGDLINIDGVTMVFDKGAEKETSTLSG